MENATHAALRTIIEAMYDSGALSEKVVRQIISALRDAKGTFGGEEDKMISDDLASLAAGLESDLDLGP